MTFVRERLVPWAEPRLSVDRAVDELLAGGAPWSHIYAAAALERAGSPGSRFDEVVEPLAEQWQRDPRPAELEPVLRRWQGLRT